MKALPLVAVISLSAAACAQPRVAPVLGPLTATNLSGCLQRTEWARTELLSLGLSPGRTAHTFVGSGGIPEMEGDAATVVLVVIAPDGVRGVLFLFPEDLLGVRYLELNAYELRRHGSRWSASEGNGGLWTYRAISDFVSNIPASAFVSAPIGAAGACGLR
jgi:hypothetical protein